MIDNQSLFGSQKIYLAEDDKPKPKLLRFWFCTGGLMGVKLGSSKSMGTDVAIRSAFETFVIKGCLLYNSISRHRDRHS